MRGFFLVLSCIFLVTGCSYFTKWRDTTGQKRDVSVAKLDAEACLDEAGYKNLSKNSTWRDLETFSAKMKTCMADRGWDSVRADAKA